MSNQASEEPMSNEPKKEEQTDIDLSTIRDLTTNIIKTAEKADEYAIAEYVKSVCDQMSAVGEDLKQYKLVRTSIIDITGGKIQYSIEKKEQL